MGATYDPRGNLMTTLSQYQPEYALYVDRSPDNTLETNFFAWDARANMWGPPQNLVDKGGITPPMTDPATVQLLVPYSALDAANENFSGSLALTVFSTGGCSDMAAGSDIIHDSAPPQGAIIGNDAGTVIDNPAFVSDMLMPLYPFDTALSNPLVKYDMPALRWRTPIYDSVDGYEVQVARDIRFSQEVESWKTYEAQKNPFFALLPASFQSLHPYADNESYYWRVRIRHEVLTPTTLAYDNGPWSPPMRFKLDSRTVGDPRLSTGDYVYMTPTFEWERVEAAAGYRIQIDDDANFSSPFVNSNVDGTSYTPDDLTQPALKPAARDYWRIAIRRADNVIGRWTTSDTVAAATPQIADATAAGFTFVKASVAPTPISPVTGMTLTDQPTLLWTAVLTPAANPRLAAPRTGCRSTMIPTLVCPTSTKLWKLPPTHRPRATVWRTATGTGGWRSTMPQTIQGPTASPRPLPSNTYP